MPWQHQDAGLLAFYRELVALRRAAPALWRGERSTVLLDDARGLYAYSCAASGTCALVVLNTGDEALTVELPGGQSWRLRLASDPAAALGSGTLALPPCSGGVLWA